MGYTKGCCWYGACTAVVLQPLTDSLQRVVSASLTLHRLCVPACLSAGFVWQTTENEWGHAVVATALSVVDDTALTSKAILGELKVGVLLLLGRWVAGLLGRWVAKAGVCRRLRL